MRDEIPILWKRGHRLFASQKKEVGGLRGVANVFGTVCKGKLVKTLRKAMNFDGENSVGSEEKKATSFICFARIQSRSFKERHRWTARSGKCIEKQRTLTVESVGTKRATSLICARTMRTSGVGGSQVDLEKESSQGNYHKKKVSLVRYWSGNARHCVIYFNTAGFL
jgi:hypothetical protein